MIKPGLGRNVNKQSVLSAPNPLQYRVMKKTINFDDVKKLVSAAKHVLIIQAENPDGDSLGSALALEATPTRASSRSPSTAPSPMS
jgi:hypothetical protein